MIARLSLFFYESSVNFVVFLLELIHEFETILARILNSLIELQRHTQKRGTPHHNHHLRQLL